MAQSPVVQLSGLVKSFRTPKGVVHAVRPGESPLTPRKHEVLAAAVNHATAGDIAAVLHLSEGTVRNYLSAAVRKLGARKRREAIDRATEKGWL